MKLPIEEWVENNISNNAIKIVREAVICYKVGAHRSSYLMFYLAFKITIRDRILSSNKPDEVSEEFWNNEIISKLTDDDKWEGKLNNIIQETIDNPTKEISKIFKFTNTNRIKNRYAYWKNIRNSCAHAKEEHITSATVEQFWNYIEDDLPEFYISGGKRYLIEKLDWIYKYFYSSSEEEFKKILKDISYVYKTNVKELFDEFSDSENNNLWNKESDNEFWKIIINFKDDNIINGLIDFLYDKTGLFFNLYSKYPKIFTLMINRRKSFVQEKLLPIVESKYYIDENIFWNLIVDILMADDRLIDLNKITADQKKLRLINKIQLNDFQMRVLSEHNIFNKFLLNAGKSFFINDANSHWNYYSYSSDISDDYIIRLFKYIRWDIELIQLINLAYIELEDSIKSRGNYDSKNNGMLRMHCYNEIIDKYADSITKVIEENNIPVSDYICIYKVLKKYNKL